MVLAAATATARTKAGDVVVDVPFAFVVPGQNFAAAHSVVTPENEVGLGISNSNGQSRSVPTPHSLRSQSDGSKLVFYPYRDTYILSGVWVTGTTTGRELYPFPAEPQVRRP